MNYDDKPIGQHKDIPYLTEYANDSEEQFGSHKENSESNLPLNERLICKNWKIRSEAFVELAKTLSSPDSKLAELNSQYVLDFSKYLSDAHPGTQEKALDAFLIYVSKGVQIQPSLLCDILVSLVEKCVPGKNNVKSKGLEAIIKLAKTNTNPNIISTILNLLSPAKTPKVVISALQTLCTLIKELGQDQMPINEILCAVEKQAANSVNAAVRAASLNVYQEAYAVIKDEIMPFISNLKHSQQEELKKKIDTQPHTQKAVLEKKQSVSPHLSSGSSPNQSPLKKEEKMATSEKIDQDLSETYGEEWFNILIKLKKWTEKRDKLDEFLKATANPNSIKIKSANEIISALKILLTDTNMIVVNHTLKAIGQLATNYNESFVSFYKGLVHPLLQKFKDKKLSAEAGKCLEIITKYTKIEEMLEDIKEELADKSTSMRISICQWLETTVLPSINKSSAKLILNSGLMKSLIKLTDEAIAEVREAAFGCIGVIQAILGDEQGLSKIVGELNQQKQEKVKVASNLARTKYGEKWGDNTVKGVEIVNTPKKIGRKSVSPPRNRKITARQQTAKIAEVTKLQQQPEVKAESGGEEEELGPSISEEEVEKIIRENTSETISVEINKAGWKEREKALQLLNNWIINNKEVAKNINEAIIIWLRNKLKDFKESNQKILKEAFTIVTNIIDIQPINKRIANILIPGLIEKLTDPKWIDICTTIVINISKSASFSFVSLKIVKKIELNTKNLNLVKEGLNILVKIIEECSSNSSSMPLPKIVECAKGFVAHPNKSVRTSASTLLCSLYGIVGEDLKQQLSDLKESTMKSLETQFSKVQIKGGKKQEENNNAQKQFTRSFVDTGPSANEVQEEIKKIQVTTEDAKSSTRANISSLITQEILNNLSDTSVKQRQKGKEQVEKILLNAGGKIQATGLGPLIGALKGRMSEPCKNLGRCFIELVGKLLSAMGTGCKQYCKVILVDLVSNLADKQNYIRAEAVIAMNKFSEVAGADLLVNTVGQLLEKESPDLRYELLQWFIKHKEVLPKTDNLILIPGLVSCLQDKSSDIRCLSEQLVELLHPLVGVQPFMTAIQDFKPTVKAKLTRIIQKYNEKYTEEKMEDQLPNSNVEVEKMEIAEEERQVSNEAKANPIQELTMTPKKSRNENINFTEEDKAVNKLSPENISKSNNSSPGKEFQLPFSQLIFIIEGEKETRAELDWRIKRSPKESKADIIERLKKSIKPAVHVSLFELMFSKTGKKQISAIKVLKEAINYEKELTALISILDLIFKWISILLSEELSADSITSVISFLKCLFNGLIIRKYQLEDFEIIIILPLLIDCLGINDTEIRENVKELIKLECYLYPPNKIANYLMKALDSNQISVIRIESLRMIGIIVQIFGLEMTTPRDIKTIGKLILNQQDNSEEDNEFKLACIDLLTVIYQYKGEAIWSNLGDIPETLKDELMNCFLQKDQTLEEIVKKTSEPKVTTIELTQEVLHSNMSIDECIRKLKIKDISTRIYCLMLLNEKIDSCISQNIFDSIDINNLLFVLAYTLQDLFIYENTEVSQSFANKLIILLKLVCGNKKLIESADGNSIKKIMEQLLVNLLHEKTQLNVDTIQKGLNSSMLMLLNNCQPTTAFCSLIELFYLYRNSPSTSKLPGLIVKCILKLTQIIQTLIPLLDIGELLICIHENLLSCKAQEIANETATKVAKTIINELVKIKKESIWESYKKLEQHTNEDVNIKRWITIIINTMNKPNAKWAGTEENKFNGNNQLGERKQSSEETHQNMGDLPIMPILQHSNEQSRFSDHPGRPSTARTDLPPRKKQGEAIKKGRPITDLQQECEVVRSKLHTSNNKLKLNSEDSGSPKKSFGKPTQKIDSHSKK